LQLSCRPTTPKRLLKNGSGTVGRRGHQDPCRRLSKDQTAALSRKLGVQTFVHDANYGYGRNQQTCYREALAAGADIVVMVHADYQYTPLLVPAMAGMIASGVYDMVLASRILGNGALKGGMPLYKFFFNRMLTAFQNIFLGIKLSEYHTGFRAFSRELLETLPLLENSDDFVFDNQMIAQAAMFNFKIGEISCPPSTLRKPLPSTSSAACNTARRARHHLQLRVPQDRNSPLSAVRLLGPQDHAAVLQARRPGLITKPSSTQTPLRHRTLTR